MATLDELQTQDTEYVKQATAALQAKKQQETAAEVPPTANQRFAVPTTPVSTSMIDSALSEAEQWGTAAKRVGQDVVAGAVTGATNIADQAGRAITASGQGLSAAEDPAHADAAQAGMLPTSPIWDHAKSSILDFRDAVAVKDPNLVDTLTQGVAQLAIPFMGYSRMLSGIHGLANIALAGAAADATALQPHDPRMADVLAMGRQTEGKLGDVLQALAPDGSAFNAYINFLADRRNESDALGTFKNVLDGFGVNMLVTPLLGAVATTLKQGTAGLRYAIENGVGSAGDFVASGSPKSQAGKIGWHGTPFNPDFFDDAKIGTGEGAQVYGYGHYIAENPETAQHYATVLAPNGAASSMLKLARATLASSGGDAREAFKSLEAKAANATHPNDKAYYQKAAQIIKAGNAQAGAGTVLKVDVPDEHIANMLDLDKPMSEQPKVLKQIGDEDRAKLEQMLEDHDQHPDLENYSGSEFRQIVERAHAEGYLTDSDLADANIPRVASNYLDSKGIPGSKYLDQVSRGPQLLGTDGHLLPVKGSAEEGARNLAIGWGGVDKAIQYAKRLGWDKPKAFDQDQEKFAALLDFKQRGADIGPGGTRNFVVFKGKNIKIVEKNGRPVEK